MVSSFTLRSSCIGNMVAREESFKRSCEGRHNKFKTSTLRLHSCSTESVERYSSTAFTSSRSVAPTYLYISVIRCSLAWKIYKDRVILCRKQTCHDIGKLITCGIITIILTKHLMYILISSSANSSRRTDHFQVRSVSCVVSPRDTLTFSAIDFFFSLSTIR